MVILSSKTLALALVLLLCTVSTPAYARFFDVDPDHPYFDAIEYLTRNDIVKGYENRSFQPARAINRAEFTAILMRMLYPQSTIDSCIDSVAELGGNTEELVIPGFDFPDVPHDSWFASYICTAWINGIVSGYPDGRFRPEEGVQFVEAAKMLALGFGLTGMELPNFGAANVVWYQPYVEFLAAQNAIPYSINTLPQPINRGEMAELIYRLREYPYAPAPVSVKSKSAEDVIYPVTWEEYSNWDYTLRFSYPNTWPEPDALPRGSYDGRSPYRPSEWSVFFGPTDTQTCLANQRCTERDMWFDGYPAEDSEDIVDAIYSDQYFITVEDETLVHGMPTITLLEEVGDCIDKRAFFFGKQWVYALNIRCAGQDQTLYDLFDHMAPSVQELSQRPPEFR